VIVVLGAHAHQLQGELHGLDAIAVENPGWSDGIGSSVRCGIEAVRRQPEVEAAVLMLCDQPLVTAQLLDTLVATHRRSGAPIVATEYAGTTGVPALFRRSLFDELVTLRPEAGAKQVIARHRAEVVGVPFPAAAIDLDTPEDFERARSGGSSV
jgi:molybdenum cofactor cytidylyltransferase